MKKFNIAKDFHPYGFHRDKGAYPGKLLKNRLDDLIKDNAEVEIEIGEMKALYGSFVDGAFGLFIDQYKEDFFKKFIFQSEKRPEYLKVISAIFARHKEIDFNG
jgi:STAS-like domain of unknown function (DUF4325)